VCVTGVPAPLRGSEASGIPVPPAEEDVAKLYQRLVAAGFLPAQKADADRKEEEEERFYKTCGLQSARIIESVRIYNLNMLFLHLGTVMMTKD
jgi:hypothetical protein